MHTRTFSQMMCCMQDLIHVSNQERDAMASRTGAYLETLCVARCTRPHVECACHSALSARRWSQTSEMPAVKTFLKRPACEQQALFKALWCVCVCGASCVQQHPHLCISAPVLCIVQGCLLFVALHCSGELDAAYAVVSVPKLAQELPSDREKVATSALGVLGNVAATEAGNTIAAEYQDGAIIKVLIALLGHHLIPLSLKHR